METPKPSPAPAFSIISPSKSMPSRAVSILGSNTDGIAASVIPAS